MRLEFSGYEFFADTNAVEAFVRETLQNSHDANPSPDERPTMVHFRFGRAPDEARDKHFEQGLPTHLSMTDALQSTDRSRFDEIRQDGSPPKWIANLDFLIVEDFHTLGTEGDHELGPKKQRKSNGEETSGSKRNRFRYFHWSWGQTDAADAKRGGSWGYGKAALNYASKIKTIIAVSTRNRVPGDDSSVHQSLMGNSIIRLHEHHGKEYNFYGHYCTLNEEGRRRPLLSTASHPNPELEAFKSSFGISRSLDLKDRGLSVVIPWPKDEFTPEAISRSVLKNYFAAIKYGTLEVRISNDSGFDEVITKKTLDNQLSNSLLAWSPDKSGEPDPEEIRVFVNLLERYTEPIVLSTGNGPEHPKWPALVDSMNDDLAKECYQKLSRPSEAETLTFRVNIPLEKRDGSWSKGYFFIIAAQNHEHKALALHRHIIRVINDERGSRVPAGISAIIAVPKEDNALHDMLRMSEGPAHLNWKPNQGRAIEVWKRPTKVIGFVRHAVDSLLKELGKTEAEKPLGTGWITVLTPKKGAVKRISGPVKVRKTSTSVPLQFTRIEGGISYRIPEDTELASGDSLKIEVAYEIRNGSPWANHSTEDFDITAGDLDLDVKGAKILSEEVNSVTLEILDKSKFDLRITGFSSDLERITRSNIVQ